MLKMVRIFFRFTLCSWSFMESFGVGSWCRFCLSLQIVFWCCKCMECVVVCRRYDAILSSLAWHTLHTLTHKDTSTDTQSSWWDGAQRLVTAVIYKNNTCLCRLFPSSLSASTPSLPQAKITFHWSSLVSLSPMQCTPYYIWFVFISSHSVFGFSILPFGLTRSRYSLMYATYVTMHTAVTTNRLSFPSSLLSACGPFFKR